MNTKNEVFEYLIDQLRQQVNNNQCEDLAHEVQALKNQLRDASAQIKELQRELEVQKAIAEGYMDALAEETRGEQSGCRKNDAQECEHDWYRYNLDGYTKMCRICGLKK